MACKLATVIDPDGAWHTWKPNREQPWDHRRAAHLYRRAAFGADWETLQAAVRRGHAATLNHLLSGGDNTESYYEIEERDAAKLVERPLRDSIELQGIWVRRMLHSPFPLLEKMTLFWHDHFATSVAKVGSVRLMQRQNALLRRHALGQFGPFLLDVCRDPAMLLWLDSANNVKGAPNENFGREIMEAFTLGPGRFSEADVREVARAFTGWSVVAGQFQLNNAEHDFGMKMVLGQLGPWSGDDVVRIVLKQQAAAKFLAGKLYRFFISEAHEPPDELIEPLAHELRESGYDIGKVVEMIIRSNLFFSELAYRQRTKSPVEFVIGMVHHLRTGPPNTSPFRLARQMEELGQKLYSPPSVFGWEGGLSWINSSQLLNRHDLAYEFTMSRFRRENPANLITRYGGATAANQVAFLSTLLLDGMLGQSRRQRIVDFLEDGHLANEELAERQGDVMHLMMLLPEYQLA